MKILFVILVEVWALSFCPGSAEACVVRQAKISEAVELASSLVVARVEKVVERTGPGRFSQESLKLAILVDTVLAGPTDLGEMQVHYSRPKVHKRGDMIVCPLLLGSGIESKLKAGERYLMLLDGDLGVRLIRAEPLKKKKLLIQAFAESETRLRKVSPALWTWDVCAAKLLPGKQQKVIDCLAAMSLVSIEPLDNKAEVSLMVGRFAGLPYANEIERVEFSGRAVEVSWHKPSGRVSGDPQRIYIEGSRAGQAVVTITPRDGSPLKIKLTVKPSVFGH